MAKPTAPPRPRTPLHQLAGSSARATPRKGKIVHAPPIRRPIVAAPRGIPIPQYDPDTAMDMAMDPSNGRSFDPGSFPFPVPAPAGPVMPSEEEGRFSRPGDQDRMTRARAAARDRARGVSPAEIRGEDEDPGDEQAGDMDVDEGGYVPQRVRQAMPAPGRAFTLPQAPIPAPRQPQPITLAQGLALSPVGPELVDNLWDWIRADGDAGLSFLGRPVTNAYLLHKLIAALVASEEDGGGHGVIRAIQYADAKTSAPVHLGFVTLSPILLAEKVAMLHVYLKRDVRPSLAPIMHDLIEDVAALVPGHRLVVWAPTPAIAKIHQQVLAPLGFSQVVMFIK